MITKQIINKVFDIKPHQYGLRGDKELWEELRSKLLSSNLVVPHYSTLAETFEEELFNAYHSIIQEKGIIENSSSIRIKGYKKEGMSGGYIYPRFWILEGLPFLVDNFKTISKDIKE